MTWRDILPVHPAADLLPVLAPDVLKALAEDIQKNGLLMPVTLWHDRDAEAKDRRSSFSTGATVSTRWRWSGSTSWG